MLNGWNLRFGGGIQFEQDVDELIRKAFELLDAKREALGLVEYDPQRFGESGDTLVEEVLKNVGEGELLNVYSVRR